MMGFEKWWDGRFSMVSPYSFEHKEIAELAYHAFSEAEREPQPCTHPAACVVSSDEGTGYCGWCADVARLREAVRLLLTFRMSRRFDAKAVYTKRKARDWEALRQKAQAALSTPADAHFGDPCIYCGVAHDDVEPGPCAKADWLTRHDEGVRREERERCVKKCEEVGAEHREYARAHQRMDNRLTAARWFGKATGASDCAAAIREAAE